MTNILYYIHDPMCSWCWAFAPTLQNLRTDLPSGIGFRRLLGGLAADSQEPMPGAMRRYLRETWTRIQQRVPGTEFNFEFWDRCEPRRSTYPACRAVIAARRQGATNDEAMTFAIQRAYYLEARNPSDTATLLALAAEIGLDRDRFSRHLAHADTQSALLEEIAQAREMGVDSFPGLVLNLNGSRWQIPVDYRNASAMLEPIDQILDSL